MRKLLMAVFILTLITSCGKSKSGSEIGKEVCDCSKKANAMDAADPKRTEAQNECAKNQVVAWNKVKDDPKKADEFNKVLSDCAKEQIKKSFGQ